MNRSLLPQKLGSVFHNPPKRLGHLAFGNECGCGKSDLNGQLRPFLIDLPARILPVDLFVKGPEHGATLSSQLFLKAAMEMG